MAATALPLRPTTDGVVLIRPCEPGDVPTLIAGRDEAFHRWLGPGATDPFPSGCIVVAGAVVGWVDYDFDRAWLKGREVNVGYNLFPQHRGRGYASRAVQLLMHHLAVGTAVETATLLISPGNAASLGVAGRTRFEPAGEVNGQQHFRRAVPPLAYSDGVISIRPQGVGDVPRHLEGIDDEQIDWLWLPGQRELWAAMSPGEQRSHLHEVMLRNGDLFDTGPKWTFAVDTRDVRCVAYVDCDLANDHVPAGAANISYSSHPAHRGKGYVRRAVGLITDFLRDHTGATEAQIIVDVRNVASLRVAAAVGARPGDRFADEHGRTMLRHVMPL